MCKSLNLEWWPWEHTGPIRLEDDTIFCGWWLFLQVTLLSGWSSQNIIVQGKKFSWLLEFAQVNRDLFEVPASCCPLQLNGAVTERVSTYKLLGVIILKDLTSNEHCDHIHNRDFKIQRLRTTKYGWMCAALVWSTGSSTDRRAQKNRVKLIDCKVQTTVKAAVFTSLSLDSICLSKKLEIPLYIVWQIT